MAKLQRQTSSSSAGFSSVNSDGSTYQDIPSARQQPGEGDEDLDNGQSVESAIFGVVYTISKEKYDTSRRYAAGKIVLDFFQLFVLVVQPDFGWRVDQDFWLWKALRDVSYKNPIIAKGYHFYITILYLTVAILCLSLALCFWVGWSFKNDRFKSVWPIKVLRVFVSVYFMMFYVASLDVFLVALECEYFNENEHQRWHLHHFPTVECLAMPHIIHAAVALVMAVVFGFVAFVLTVADFELNPISQRLLATPYATVELRTLAVKTIMTIAATLLDGYTKWQALLLVFCSGMLTWSYFAWEPHFNEWVNHVRCALYGSISWASLWLCILVFNDQRHTKKFQQMTTTAMLSGLAPAMLIFFWLSYLRLHWNTKQILRAFRNMQPDQRLKDIYKFADVFEVELATRVCRTWMDEDTLDESSMELAETIIKAGLARFNGSIFLTILHSNFLIEVRGSYQSGHSLIQATRKLGPNISQRFVIYVREQEHRQKAQATASGEATVDLVSYVEFQRNYRQLIQSHKAALYSVRNFWKALLHHDVSFSMLTSSFSAIESTQIRAEKMYNMVLERYPKSAKLLHAYARFLEDVKNDPWRAAHSHSEAEKLDEEADAAPALGGLEGAAEGDTISAGQVDEKSNAVVLINATGVIQMANKNALKMFGYKKGDLEGKNVSCLMPPPFSQRHNSFLHNYLTTGKAKILDTVRSVVALHKDRYVFPIKIAVTKASGSGADSVFMGVLLPMQDDPNSVRCWIMPTGTVLCVDQRFMDWFAKSHSDCVGKSFASLAVEQDLVNEFIAKAQDATMEQLTSGKIVLEKVNFLHKYLDNIAVDIVVELGGTEAQKLFVMNLHISSMSSNNNNLMVTDAKGLISYTTSSLAHMLGYKLSDMSKRMGIADLMHPPFSLLHAQWLKELPIKLPSSSCRVGATVLAVTSAGTSLPVKLTIKQREEAEKVIHLIQMDKSSYEEGIEQRTLSLHISDTGAVVEVNNTPSTVFGFKPSILVGKHISEFIDVFQQLNQPDSTVTVLDALTAMATKMETKPKFAWRVGLQPPATGYSQHSSLASKQVKPALMQLDVLEEEKGTVLTLHLTRADALTGILELDRDGRICKAGLTDLYQPGPIFGWSTSSMARQSISSYIEFTSKKGIMDALLEDDGKKSALRAGSNTKIRIGPVKKLVGKHADQQPLSINIQACDKDASGRRVVVKVQVASPAVGDVDAFKRTLHLVPELTRQGTGGLKRSNTGIMVLAGAELVRSGTSLKRREAADKALEGYSRQHSQVHKSGVKFQGADPNSDDADGGDDDDDDDDDDDGAEFNNHAEEADLALMPEPEMPFVDGDSASAATSNDLGGSDAQSDTEQQTDYRKGKRCKKLLKLLGGKKAQKAVSRFRLHTYIVLLGLIVAHIVCFAVVVTQLNSLHQYVYEVNAAGIGNDMIHRIAINLIILRELHLGRSAPGIYEKSDVPTFVSLLSDRLNALREVHNGLFFGFQGIRRLQNKKQYHLRDEWEASINPKVELIDTRSSTFRTTNSSLWHLGNEYIYAGYEIAHNHDLYSQSKSNASLHDGDLANNRFWQFIIKNGPTSLYEGYRQAMDGLVMRAMDEVDKVNVVTKILLVLEGCCICFIAVVYIWMLMQRVSHQRFKLFTVFLMVPAGFLRTLASKQVHVDDDDVDNDDEDDARAGTQPEPPPESKPKALEYPTAREASVVKKVLQLNIRAGSPDRHVGATGWKKLRGAVPGLLGHLTAQPGIRLSSKRKLMHDTRDTYLLTIPFVLWMAMVLIVYSVSYKDLSAASAPLVDNNIADRVLYRITRVIYYAFNHCNSLLPFPESQSLLQLVTTRLGDTYKALMYGSPTPFFDSHWSTPGTTFRSPRMAKIFFRAHGRCFHHGKCFNTSSEYYEITSNGLDAMLGRLVEEAGLLAVDLPQDVNVSNSRLQYIWKVANYHLHTGMTDAAQMYTTDSLNSFNAVRTMHLALFGVCWGLVLCFLLLVFWPFLRRIKTETRRVAELLSQLPDDMDVEGIVEQALGKGSLAVDDDAPPPSKRRSTDYRRSAETARSSIDTRPLLEGHAMQARDIDGKVIHHHEHLIQPNQKFSIHQAMSDATSDVLGD